MGGLFGVRIDAISSDVPPPFGVQSSQPTLPGPFLQRGTMTRVNLGHGVGVRSGLLEPSHVTMVTGAVTGRTMQPVVAPQVPWSSPLTAVASVFAWSVAMPIVRATKVPNVRCPNTRTPATGPTIPLGQSGLVLRLVGRAPIGDAPTTAASAVEAAFVPSGRR